MFNKKSLIKSLKKRHQILMNSAYCLTKSESEKRKSIMRESSIILMQILRLESQKNNK